ncbi:MAG: hypothetical protein KatS3mg105_2764 [Gemmatales bacterium]|nr:MAG: hypothetical protein KatS3mg105_2764 [Gemmatales bacterium]
MSHRPEQCPSFEEALAELEEIVRELEDGQISLEESLQRYEKGVNLLKQCYSKLQEAEQRISLLTGMDAEGRPIIKPFTPETASEIPAGKQPSSSPEEPPELF